MAHTKLPLTQWFLAMYLLTQSNNGLSAMELRCQEGKTTTLEMFHWETWSRIVMLTGHHIYAIVRP
jgi:hypothetical protein